MHSDHQNDNAPDTTSATRPDTAPSDASPCSKSRRKLSYSDGSEFIYDLTDLGFELCRYLSRSFRKTSNRTQKPTNGKRTNANRVLKPSADAGNEPLNALEARAHRTQGISPIRSSPTNDLSCAEDFLTSQRRIDAVADILATIALRIVRKGVAHEPTTP